MSSNLPIQGVSRQKLQVPAIKNRGFSKTINSQAITVLAEDSSGNVLKASGTVTVTDGGAGYAKGCLYIDTDVAAGTTGVYENVGTTAACNFDTIGSGGGGITTIAAATDTDISGPASGELLIWDGVDTWDNIAMSGDVTIDNAGATEVADLTMASEAQGDVLYFDGTNWVVLAAGTNGQYLKTQGAAADPIWSTVIASTASGLSSPFTIEGGTNDPVTTVIAQTVGAAALGIPDLANVAQDWVFTKVAQTLAGKTLTEPILVDGGFIADANGAEGLILTTTASAVNEVTLIPSATGNAPALTATGDDANVDLELTAKGTGVVTAGGVEVVTLTGTQTLTNKTLTTPVIASMLYSVGGNAITLQDAVQTVIGRDTTDTLTNKTIDADGTGNAISNLNADELDPVATGNYGIPFVISYDVSNAATTDIYNADAPFKFRILRVDAVSTAAGNSGTFKLDNGTNDVTTAVSYGTSDTDMVSNVSIDDAYMDIAGSGSLRCINSSATDDALLNIYCLRIA